MRAQERTLVIRGTNSAVPARRRAELLELLTASRCAWDPKLHLRICTRQLPETAPCAVPGQQAERGRDRGWNHQPATLQQGIPLPAPPFRHRRAGRQRRHPSQLLYQKFISVFQWEHVSHVHPGFFLSIYFAHISPPLSLSLSLWMRPVILASTRCYMGRTLVQRNGEQRSWRHVR